MIFKHLEISLINNEKIIKEKKKKLNDTKSHNFLQNQTKEKNKTVKINMKKGFTFAFQILLLLPCVEGDGLRSPNIMKSQIDIGKKHDEERKLWFWSCPSGNAGDGCSVFCPCSGNNTCEAWNHVCRGPGKEGDSCHLTKPCGSGLNCEAGSHICRAPGKEGDSCHLTRPCGSGLNCEAGSHICRAPGKEGDSCHLTRPCGSGLNCEAGSHICRAPGKEGDSCHLTRPCGSGLNCEAGSHICRAPGKAGDPCHATRPCGDDVICMPLVHKCFPEVDVFGEACLDESIFANNLMSLFASTGEDFINEIVSSQDTDKLLTVFSDNVLDFVNLGCGDVTVYTGAQADAQVIGKGSTSVGIYASSDGKIGAYVTYCYGGGVGVGANAGVVGGVLLGSSNSFPGESEVFDNDFVVGAGISTAMGFTADYKAFVEVGASGGGGLNLFSYQTCQTEIIEEFLDIEVGNDLSNYDLYPFMDSSGNDIGKFDGGIRTYAVKCNADPDCLGFNSNGWLKHVIRDQSEWSSWTEDSSKGLYIKKGHKALYT